MESKFKIGDRVVIVKCPHRPEFIGTVCHVISDIEIAIGAPPGVEGFYPAGTPIHCLDVESKTHPGLNAWAPPYWLELYKDDGNEKGEWTDELRNLCKMKEKVNVNS